MDMAKKPFNPCCGCIKLNTCCLILSYLRLVLEITLVSYIPETISGWFKGVTGDFIYFLFIIGLLTVVFMTLSIVACLVLLVALHMSDHNYVAVYVKHARGCIFITLAFCIHKLVSPTTTQHFAQFGIGFILLLLQGYFLIVIQCYVESCRSMVQEPQPATTAVAPVLVPAPVATPMAAHVAAPVAASASPPVPHRCSDAK